MESIALPAHLVIQVLRLANEFGEPFFSALIGEGDGMINGIEEGRVAVLDAEFAIVANYPPAQLALAERLAALLNTITHDLAGYVPEEVRRQAIPR